MSEYTAEDFAQAMFARHGDGGRAARFAGDKWPWRASTADAVPWLSDEEMARDGWVPVPQIDSEAHPDQVESQRIALEDLRQENDRLERIFQTPLSLKDLEVAWEAAEVPTRDNPIRKGDTLISSGHGGYLIRSAVAVEDGWAPSDSYRILHRAPQPEPWETLADVLEGAGWNLPPDLLARHLHERGVRVTGGDET